MQELIFNAVSQMVDGKTLLILIGLYFIYRRIGLVECGVRAGLLAHITRIHDGAMKNGRIGDSAFRIVEDCYKQYHALNGNGYGTSLMNELRDLHDKKDNHEVDATTTNRK